MNPSLLPFQIFIGEKKLVPNAVLSISEAAHPFRLEITLNPSPREVALMLVNLTTDELYGVTMFFYSEKGENEGQSRYPNYRNYPTDPGTYVFYVMNIRGNNTWVQGESPVLKVPGFSQQYKPSNFGQVLGKLRFYVQAKSNILTNLEILPKDIRKYLVSNNFSIYDILDFCLSSLEKPIDLQKKGKDICNDDRFWQLLVRTRLTTDSNYVLNKDTVINDLKKSEYLLNESPNLGEKSADPIEYFTNFDVVLKQLRKKWLSLRSSILSIILYLYVHLVNPDSTTDQWMQFTKIVQTWFPNITIDNNTRLYDIYRQIIPQLSDTEFDIAFESEIKTTTDIELFRLLLDNIDPSEREEAIARYNRDLEIPFEY